MRAAAGVRARAVALAAAGLVALAGCGGDAGPEPSHLRAFAIHTHCGVGEAEIAGIVYYPTAIYANGELIAGGDGAPQILTGGPTPWITSDGLTSDYPEGVADNNFTFGTVATFDDGTAEFAVADGIHTVRYSANSDDAVWVVENCD